MKPDQDLGCSSGGQDAELQELDDEKLAQVAGGAKEVPARAGSGTEGA